MFYFIRHGEVDYSEKGSKIYQGFGENLAGLTKRGIAQVEQAARDERLRHAGIILSSPYTRALQTAAILARELKLDLRIETDLHEWIANKDYLYVDDETAGRAWRDYQLHQGCHPSGEERSWEEASSMKTRALGVLQRYLENGDVIVVCHGMLMEATTGCEHPDFAEIVELDFSDCLSER